MTLKEKLRNLPSSPGVYLMKDSFDSILYVGKAKNLKRRVQSYFQNSKSHSPKTEKLVKHLRDFDYILTDTEFEAFMLECQLIKQIKPIYNKKMKSPMSYSYLVIKDDKQYPILEVSSNPISNDLGRSFGPYTSKSTLERALQGLREGYKILCNRPAKKSTTCLNHSLGLCIGMCQGGPAKEAYKIIINKFIALFDGVDSSLLDELQQKMSAASDKFDFKAAAKYRDAIDSINFMINKERVIEFIEENKNIAFIEYLDGSTFKFFLVRRNKVLLSKKYELDSTKVQYLSKQLKNKILALLNASSLNSPSLEINRDELDEAQIIFSYLKGSTCSYISIPDKWLTSDDNPLLEDALNDMLSSKKGRISSSL